MKQLVSVIILFFLFQTSSHAQYESMKGYAGLSLGVGVPVGDFASQTGLENSGFANRGFALKMNFAYRISANFGVTGMILVQSNPINEESVLAEIKKTESLPGNPKTYSAVDADSWGLSGFMVGGYASIPVGTGGKIILEPRFMGGILTAISPRTKITWREGTRTVWEEQQIGAGIALGYNLGGTVRFNLSDRIALLLNTDYLKTSPKFFDVLIQQSNGQQRSSSFQQKIEVVSVTVGFSIRIRKERASAKRPMMPKDEF